MFDRRWGLVLVVAGILGFALAIWIGITETGSCETSPSGLIGFLSVVSGIVEVLVGGGGWAIAIRAVWVVFATLATVDIWIFYISVLIGVQDPDAIAGLLLLAFAIHAICMALAPGGPSWPRISDRSNGPRRARPGAPCLRCGSSPPTRHLRCSATKTASSALRKDPR